MHLLLQVLKYLTVAIIVTIHAHGKVYINQAPIALTIATKSWIEIKNNNLTRQKRDYSCASASLSTILTYYYDQNVTEEEILNEVMEMKHLNRNSSPEAFRQAGGLSFLDLAYIAQNRGFKAIGLAISMQELQKVKAPLILHVKIRDNEHFTVFKGIDSEYVYLADPSFGNTKIKRSKFQEIFYQREDLKYPGRALIILPPKHHTKKIESFMKKPKKSPLIEQSIKMQSMRLP